MPRYKVVIVVFALGAIALGTALLTLGAVARGRGVSRAQADAK
jgi:hypothetical protein